MALAIFILYARIEVQNWHVAAKIDNVWHSKHELYKLFAPFLGIEIELKHDVNTSC